MRILLLLVTVLLTFTYSFSQTKGLILEPAGSVLGKSILDPNGDHQQMLVLQQMT
jgi:hypothetical protein